ncbi:MAG TPA: response regulator [Blastocatellia bacterium]|nr:response regulator [Blastocatellia bacterium]
MHASALNCYGTVLLVEDLDDSRFMLRRLLELEGFDVVEAKDGALALEALRKQPCDVVLLDLRMPHIDGFQVTRALRATTQFQSLPIIILSALDDEYARTEARAAGCNDYLTKPIDFDRLTMLLKKHISLGLTSGH